MLKKIINRYWPYLLIFALSFLVTWPVLRHGYFSHHDDLQVIRIFEMRRCLTDFQIPCRWVPDMGFGNGFPLFNFYGVFPYFLGAILSFVVGYINSAKILFLIPLLLGGISMYLLGTELFGKKAGFAAGVLFMFAPYRALDLYVRGAVAESFALSLIPLVFYFSLRLIKKPEPFDFVATVLTTAFFLTSHNIMTLVFIPVLVCYVFLMLYLEKWKNIKTVVLSLVLGAGVSAFFVIPAFLEKNLVLSQSLTESAFDFKNHFISISRLFIDRSWGYTGSPSSMAGNMSFQIGWPHWWVVLIALAIIAASMIKVGAKNIKNVAFPLFLVVIFLISVLMINGKSIFIWEKISILRFVQFPWRFLSLSIFSSSLLGGYIIFLLKGKLSNLFVVLVVVATILLNWTYFRPQTFYPNVTDATKLSGEDWKVQQVGSITDFLPVTALKPLEPAPSIPQVVKGTADVSNFINRSDSFKFSVTVLSDSIINIPVFDFPNWTVKVNGVVYGHSLDHIGRIEIVLSPGNYVVEGHLRNTPVRSISNIISGVSIFAFILYMGLNYGKTKKITE